MSIEFGNAGDEFVGVVEILITRVTKALMPKELLGSSANGMHRDRLIEELLEAKKVDVFEFTGGITKCLIELAMFSCFGMCNFNASCLCTSTNKGGILCSREFERVAKRRFGVVCGNIRKDEWMSVELTTKEASMDNDITSFRSPVMTNNGHVSNEHVVFGKPAMDCLSSEVAS